MMVMMTMMMKVHGYMMNSAWKSILQRLYRVGLRMWEPVIRQAWRDEDADYKRPA